MGERFVMDMQTHAVEVLRKLSAACYEWLGPASSWGSMALGNAEAIERDFTTYPQWLSGRAIDWRNFAQRTDPELRTMALEAADAIAKLAMSVDKLGTLLLRRGLLGDWIGYHAGAMLDE